MLNMFYNTAPVKIKVLFSKWKTPFENQKCFRWFLCNTTITQMLLRWFLCFSHWGWCFFVDSYVAHNKTTGCFIDSYGFNVKTNIKHCFLWFLCFSQWNQCFLVGFYAFQSKANAFLLVLMPFQFAANVCSLVSICLSL